MRRPSAPTPTSASPTAIERLASREPSSPRTCRAGSSTILIEPATLVVSEVVTNAVIHARSDAELVLERTPTALRISVTDRGSGLAREPASNVSDGGRGLLIVQQLSTSWGAEPTGDGNRVWAELSIES